MEKQKTLTVIAVIGSICSITGLSLLGLIEFFSDKRSLPLWAFALVSATLVVCLIAVWTLRRRVLKEVELRNGRIVSAGERSRDSKGFASGTLRSLRIFGGDLSWIEEDLTVYRDLVNRGVRIQILTDTPGSSAVPVAKGIDIEVREYPEKMEAPLKVSLSDAEEEGESRALIVKRRTFRPGAKRESKYCYWMKEYHGSVEYAAIKAMMLLFDKYFATGNKL